MTAKHTPGPWHRNIKPASKYTVIFAGRNKHIAAVKTIGLSEAEIEANMDLIVAAPRLLDALRAARRQVAEDRDGLIAGHKNFATGRIEDDLGRAALRRYNAVLARIDLAISAATGSAA